MGLMCSVSWNSSFRKRIARSCTYPNPSQLTSLWKVVLELWKLTWVLREVLNWKQSLLLKAISKPHPTPSHCDCQLTSLWRKSGWRTTSKAESCWCSKGCNSQLMLEFFNDQYCKDAGLAGSICVPNFYRIIYTSLVWVRSQSPHRTTSSSEKFFYIVSWLFIRLSS